MELTFYSLLAVCTVCVAIGIARIAMWFRHRTFLRLDSEYRACALIAQSKREVRR